MIIKHNTELTNAADAKQRGFTAITREYLVMAGERQMRDAVIADMRRGNIQHMLVGSHACQEVWRRPV